MERIALRWTLPIVAVAVCFTCFLTRPSPEPQVSWDGWSVVTPAPPVQNFILAAVASPAVISAGPLFIVNEVISGPSYLDHSLLCVATALFWFVVGYKCDDVRGVLKRQACEPRWIGVYIVTFRCLSTITLGLMLLGLANYHQHFGAPPLWSFLVLSGIIFTWCFVGAFPLLTRFRKRVTSPTTLLTPHSSDREQSSTLRGACEKSR